MNRKTALRILTDWVRVHLTTSPIDEQVKLFEALSHVLPTPEERRRASEISTTLSEVAKLQLEFTGDLFESLRRNTRDGQ